MPFKGVCPVGEILHVDEVIHEEFVNKFLVPDSGQVIVCSGRGMGYTVRASTNFGAIFHCLSYQK
jgi:hypothetical protein